MKNTISTDKITDVTVFQDRAIINRSDEIKFTKGRGEYIFKNLPASINNQSIRVKGFGELLILGLDIYDEYLDEYSEQEIIKIKNELINFKLLEISLNNKIKNNEFKRNFLNNLNFDNIKIVDRNDFKKINSGDYQALYDFYKGNYSLIDQENFKLKNELAELIKKIKKIEFDLNKISSGKSLKIINCRINYEAQVEGIASLLVSYMVNNAKWNPLYDARLNHKKRILELTYFAQTTQTTGENWKDVNLSFSTAQPQIGAFLPDIAPWYVDFYYPPPPSPKMYLKRSMKKDSNREGEKEKEEKLGVDMIAQAIVSDDETISASIDKDDYVQSEVATSGINAVFNAMNTYSVDSDGTVKKALLLIDEFPVKLEYIIIPRLSENAYLKAKIKNNKNYPLLSGKVNVYHDNNYVGESNISTVSANEEFEIFLGIDPGIDVKYQLLNKFTQKSGLTSQNNKIIYKYRITINSYKENEEEIQLFEQIPLSGDKDIKVKIENQDIFNSPDQNGTLFVVFTLKPKEKKELNFSYSVEYPKDKNINGLE